MASQGRLPSADNFVPNQACLQELQAMGFDQETAAQVRHTNQIYLIKLRTCIS